MANQLGPNSNLVQSAGSMGGATGGGSNSQEKCTDRSSSAKINAGPRPGGNDWS